MISSLEWQLRLITWEFFVTLTWDPRKHPFAPRTRWKQAQRWLYDWATREGVSPEDLDVVIRGERGEVGELPHYHLLLARFPAHAISLSRCFAQAWQWNHLRKPGHDASCKGCRYGISQIRLYDPERNGPGYLSEGKFSGEWARGANSYELRKFDSADFIYINPRALQSMQESRTVGRRMLPVLR
jgi:hypothetical protein